MPAHGKDPFIYIGILLVIEWLQREEQFRLQDEKKGIFRYCAVRWAIYYIVFITTTSPPVSRRSLFISNFRRECHGKRNFLSM